jgi:hypothetical protein
MGPKAFKFALASIGGFLALSALPGTGVMIGLFFAFSIAFFAAPIAFGLQHIAGLAGWPVGFETLVKTLVAIYGAAVVLGFARAFRAHSMGDPRSARRMTAKAALFAALPMAGYLSMPILAKAWP